MNETNSRFSTLCKYAEPESVIAKTVKLMTCLVLGAFGIFGNVFVIVLAVKYTVTKSMHFLIINLAVANILFVIFHVQRYITDNFLTNGISGHTDLTVAQILCKTLPFLYYVFGVQTLVTLLVISIERYRITTRVSLTSSQPSGKRRGIVIAGCWLVTMIMNTDTLIFDHIEIIDSELICIRSYMGEENTLKVIIFTILLTLNMTYYFIMVLLSFLTLRRLSKAQPIEESLSELQRQQRRKRIRNSVKMVLYSLLLYSCGFLPFAIAHVIDCQCSNCRDLPTLFFFTWYFPPLFSFCLSPCIYCICLSDFREAARRLLCGNTGIHFLRGSSIAPTTRRNENTDM